MGRRANDELVIGIARQHDGIVTRRDVLRTGLSPKVLHRLHASGVLGNPHPGVYVLAGATPGHLRDLRAALAAVGAGAAASHRSAAWLHGLVDRPPACPHLTVSTRTHLTITGITIHRPRRPGRTVFVRGIRCTEAGRTLADLAGVSEDPQELSTAVDRALANGLVTLNRLDTLLPPSPTQGSGRLRRYLAERGYIGGPEASVLESKMARILAKTGLPAPKSELVVGAAGQYRIDFAYPERRLAIECYGYVWHRSSEQMTYDLKRQRALELDGWMVLVYTWKDVTTDAEGVGAEIVAAYRRAGGVLDA